MIKIGICDDQIEICSEIEEYLEKFAASLCEKFEIEIYYTGEKLLADLKNEVYYDLLILDIEMPDINGVFIGNYIRYQMRNNDISIIYISSHVEHAIELFSVRPFQFLVKPVNAAQINNVMNTYIQVTRQDLKYFSYPKGKKVNLKDILYFSIKGRFIQMATVSKQESFYGSLSEIYQKLQSDQFFYANKSQIVNYNQVAEFYYDRLIMEDGTEITISQGKRKDVLAMQNKYEEQNMRQWDDL